MFQDSQWIQAVDQPPLHLATHLFTFSQTSKPLSMNRRLVNKHSLPTICTTVMFPLCFTAKIKPPPYLCKNDVGPRSTEVDGVMGVPTSVDREYLSLDTGKQRSIDVGFPTSTRGRSTLTPTEGRSMSCDVGFHCRDDIWCWSGEDVA